MIAIEPKQIQQIQISLKKSHPDRDERLGFISNFLQREVNSTKDLTKQEADELLSCLYKENYVRDNWASFNIKTEKYRSERKLLFSLMHQAQWVVPNERHNEVPDLNRLSNFLKSPKSPVQKPLMKMVKSDWEKLITVFTNIVRGTYK